MGIKNQIISKIKKRIKKKMRMMTMMMTKFYRQKSHQVLEIGWNMYNLMGKYCGKLIKSTYPGNLRKKKT
jgi:hypothetical protein